MTTLVRGAVAAAFLVLLAAVPVLAHAELEESDPADGETITTQDTLIATFTEEFDAERSFLRVKNSAGSTVADGHQDPDDPNVMVADLEGLDLGTYTVQWQTVTPDDNGVEHGTFTFNVAQAVGTDGGSSQVPTTPGPSASARPSVAPTAAPSVAPSPAPTPTSSGPAAASGNDVLLALALAAVVLVGLGIYLFTRRR